MNLEVYAGQGVRVIVADKGKLPAQGEPYTILKTINVEPGGGPRAGADSDEILKNVESQGYHVWPEGADNSW